MIEAALRYASMGYRVIPLAPRGRVPIITNQNERASADAGQVREWWTTTPNANIGILAPTGGELMVLDIEGSDGHAVPGTDAWIDLGGSVATMELHPTQKTPSGGFHVFGRAPDEIPEFGPNLRPGIEIFGARAKVKYLIVGPSVVDADPAKGKPSGVYEWTQELVDVGDLPSFPAELFHGMAAPKTAPGPVAPRERDGYTDAVLAYGAQHPLALPRGTRRVDCPVCGSKGCWGRLAKRDDQWCCWSETHQREHPDAGRPTADGDAFWGDALDLAVARGEGTRTEILKAAGLLKDLPGQLERYRRKTPQDAPDGSDGYDPEDEPTAPGGAYEVYIPGGHGMGVGEVTDDAFSTTVLNRIPKGNVFMYSGNLVTPMGERTRLLSLHQLRRIVSRHVLLRNIKYTQRGGFEEVKSRWNSDLAALVEAAAHGGHPNVLEISGVVREPMPIFTDDGIRFLQPGWNPGGWYLIDDNQLAGVEPMTNRADIYRTLTHSIREFPFAPFPAHIDENGKDIHGEGNNRDASEANAIAAMLTIFVRPLIDGAFPIFVFMAPTQSTGKTWLAETLANGATGKDPKERSLPKDETKLDEIITSLLVQPDLQCALFDNVRSEDAVGSPALEQVTGSRTFSDRAKYSREAETYPNNVVFMMSLQTGTRLNRDLATRSVGIYLDSDREDPERRRFGFVPMQDARSRYREIVSAMMGAVKLWGDAGMPRADVRGRQGDWAGVIGGIINEISPSLGASFLGNQEAFQYESHAQREPWDVFAEEWADGHGARDFTGTKLLWMTCVRDPELDIGPAGDNAIVFGRWLSKFKSRTVKVGERRFKYLQIRHARKVTHRLEAR